MQIGSLAETAELGRAVPNEYVIGGRASSPKLADAFKFAFEWIVAALAVVLLGPLMLLVALAILVADGRPVFFGHRRVGRDGKTFRCLKFRTMAVDAEARLAGLLASDAAARREWALTQKLADDPRILPMGRVLRALSLDELPQFLNVLLGDMSLVGPRPVTSGELARYGAGAARYVAVRPGLTGPWQIGGRSGVSFQERVAIDVDYVSNRTFLGDVDIILRTPAAVIKRTGAC